MADQKSTFGVNVTMSADGALLATLSDSVDVWNTDPAANFASMCGFVGDVNTREQWSQYVPHEAYRPPCKHPNTPDHYLVW